jgi:acyl-CoA thioesterase YciA
MKAKHPAKRRINSPRPTVNRSPGAENPAASSGRSHAGENQPRSAAGALQPAIRIIMMPRDVNPLGTIFGGLILSYIDLAGVVEAHRHSNKTLVTAAMHEVKFIAPVFVGDLVSFYSEILKLGNSSITVRVTVEATRVRPPNEIVRVTQAEVVYVAIDEAGRPVSIRR